MKLNAPGDLLSKIQDICIAAVFMADNDENTKFLFCRNSFHLKEMRCKQSYCRYVLLQKTKTGIYFMSRNAGNVKSN